MTQLAHLEGRHFATFTARDWVTFLCGKASQPSDTRRRRTAIALRFLRFVFAKWTALPGDVFYDMPRDVYMVVHSGRPGNLLGYKIAGQIAELLRTPQGVVAADPLSRMVWRVEPIDLGWSRPAVHPGLIGLT